MKRVARAALFAFPFVWLALLALELHAQPSPGSADPAAPPRVTAEPGDLALDVDLARVCVGEAGWRVVDTGECAAILDVAIARSKARGVGVRRALRDYAHNHFDAARSSRPWIAGLDVAGTEPEAWPERLDWRRYRPRWLLVIEHARKCIAGDVAPPCIGPLAAWGGAMDDWRARAAGLERAACAPGVRNHFWRVPRRRGRT